MRIENWVIWGISIWGDIYEDEKKRWADGHSIKTSAIVSNMDNLKEGSIVDTKNSTYILGKPLKIHD